MSFQEKILASAAPREFFAIYERTESLRKIHKQRSLECEVKEQNLILRGMDVTADPDLLNLKKMNISVASIIASSDRVMARHGENGVRLT